MSEVIGFKPTDILFLLLMIELCQNGKSFGCWRERNGTVGIRIRNFGSLVTDLKKLQEASSYIHVPDVQEHRRDLVETGFSVESDFLRSKISQETSC